MLRIRRRIELLEQAFPQVAQGPPQIIRINYVDSDGTVVDTHLIEIPSGPPAPTNRGWRSAQRSCL